MESQWVRYLFVLGIVGLAAVLIRSIRGARAGRVMVGTRDNEKAASALAVPTTRVKLQTFILSGALAGLAGALYVLVLAPVGAGQGTFPAASSIEVFSYAVIGGLGSVAGAVSGVGLFRLLDFVLAKQFSGRSEEQTSELQSLMRYSFTVLILQKQK